jgi:hypothetical protein
MKVYDKSFSKFILVIVTPKFDGLLGKKEL